MEIGAELPGGEPTGMGEQAVRSITTRYIILFIGVMISVLLSRALAATGRGAYAYIIAFASSVAWASHLSVETSLMLSWSDERVRGHLAGAALAVAALAGALAVTIVFGGARFFHLAIPEGGEPWMLMVAVAATPGVVLALYLNAILVNDGRIDDMNRVGLLTAIAQLLVLAALVGTNVLSVASSVVLWAGSMTLPLFLLLPLVREKPGISWPGLRFVWRFVAVGLRYHPAAVALALIFRVDILLLGSRVDVAQLGVYSLAVALVELCLVATSANSQVAVQVQVRGDPHDHAGFAAAVSRVNAILGCIVAIPIVATGPWAIPRVFGESYSGAIVPVIALVPGVLALAMMRPIVVFVYRLNRPYVVSGAVIMALVANIGLNLVMIPLWGILGAAVASSVVYIALTLGFTVWFLRSTGLGWLALVPSGNDFRIGWMAVRGQSRPI